MVTLGTSLARSSVSRTAHGSPLRAVQRHSLLGCLLVWILTNKISTDIWKLRKRCLHLKRVEIWDRRFVTRDRRVIACKEPLGFVTYLRMISTKRRSPHLIAKIVAQNLRARRNSLERLVSIAGLRGARDSTSALTQSLCKAKVTRCY